MRPPSEALLRRKKEGKPVPPPKPKGPESGPGRAAKLGRYTLLRAMARGGMGEVYLATSGGIEGAERPCVVKLIRREHAQDRSFLARFFDEARIQAQLQHPGVAQVLEASTDQGGMPYVVLEYVEGKNLGELRQRAAQLGVPVSWADAVAVALSLAEALTHVHERTDPKGRALDIVHRDLSPQNVMVGYGGDVKLIDFGTARGENRRCQTVAGVVFAKPGYVAPEVANNVPGGPQADIYALGIILWELCMGRKFLVGDPEEHLAEVAAGRRSPSPVSLTNNVPLELDTIIARMTALDVRDRFETAREVTAALLRVLKRAPSLADGERGVRTRIAHLMARLYPAEPAKSRNDFAQLIAVQRTSKPEKPAAPVIPESPKVESADEKDLLPGTRYRLGTELKKSAMSVVYEAEHLDLGRRVALKVLPKERCDDPRFERRFRTEARTLASLRHQNLVQLHDFGVSLDGRPYYAMELLEGETLEARAARGLPSWSDVVRLGMQLCAALSVVHQRGVVHRDVKPSNVFITTSGGLKLLDFGVAQTEPGEGEEAEHSNAIELMGTAEYMAPEQIGREPVDERADVYAVGVVLYELLTGRLPHAAEGIPALLLAKRADMPPMPRKLSPHRGAPLGLDMLLLKALAPDKDTRFRNIEAMGRALAHVLDAPRRSRRRRRFAVTIGLSTLGLGLAFGWYQDDPHAARAMLQRVDVFNATPAVQTDASRPPFERLQLSSNPATGVVSLADTKVGFQRAAEPVESTAASEDAAPDGVEEAAGAQGVDAEEARESDENPHPVVGEANAPAIQDDAEVAEEQLDEGAATDTEQDEAFLSELARADRLFKQGAAGRERALELCRKLAEEHPDDPALLELWSKTAARAKWWGESLRVAIRWATVDPSEASHLHLARTQRLVGQPYGAIQTLERLLVRMPENQKALAILERYRSAR